MEWFSPRSFEILLLNDNKTLNCYWRLKFFFCHLSFFVAPYLDIIRPSPYKAQTAYFLITCLWLLITGLWKVIICLWIVIICLFIVLAKQVSNFFMCLITRTFWLEALLAWPNSLTLHFNWHDRPKCPCCVFVFITIFNSQKYNNYCMK